MHVYNSYLACADPQEFLPGGSRPDCQKTALKTFFVVVFFGPLVLQRVSNGHFKENYNFLRFERGPTFSRGGSTFSRGVQMLISKETHITCD